jgi:hypothetical protein
MGQILYRYRDRQWRGKCVHGGELQRSLFQEPIGDKQP